MREVNCGACASDAALGTLERFRLAVFRILLMIQISIYNLSNGGFLHVGFCICICFHVKFKRC